MNLLYRNLNFLLNENILKESDMFVVFGKGLPAIEEASFDPNASQLMRLKQYAGIDLDTFLEIDLAKQQQMNQEKDIRFLVLDVDGSLTDGGVYYSEEGDDIKKFNAHDGRGLIRVTRKGFDVAFLSSSFLGNIINRRAETLGVDRVYVGTEKKVSIVKIWCEELGITMDQVAYLGDDVNDVELIKTVGFSLCPSDAVPEVLRLSDVVLSKKGGTGCIRECIDRFIWPKLMAKEANPGQPV